MIADTLDRAALYHSVHPLFAAAFDYIQRFDPATPDADYPLAGGTEARVMSYATKPMDERRWESHLGNIDIQFVLTGAERTLWTPVGDLAGATPYDEAKDVIHYAAENPAVHTLDVRAGAFVVFYPHDGHRPGIRLSGSDEVRKIVMKVPVTPR